MERPNIVVILTDDQGPWAMGCAGNSEIVTPNLDRLADTGTRFENFFCTSPVCSPARASLLTGMIPSQHGVLDWIREGNDGADGIEYLKDTSAYTDILAAHGYRCGLSGKWHLGRSDVAQKGFSHWYVHQKGSGHYFNAPMYREGKLEHRSEYVSYLIADDAIDFIRSESKKDAPFYCGVHFTAPHSPWGPDEHPAELRAIYEDCAFKTCPQEPYHPKSRFRFGPKEAHECLVGYFSAVTGLDMGVGRILDTLEELGVRERTLVFFLSDNGFNCGHHGIWGKGNGTLDLNMFDTSVKVPAIASMPGTVPAGRVSNALVSGYDFLPTLLDFLNLPHPSGDSLPGSSFLRALIGKSATDRDHVIVFDEYGPVRMIRTLEWKYVHRYPYGEHELYHLSEDPEEKVNRISDRGTVTVTESLKATLDDWFLRYVDPRIDGTKEAVTGDGQLCRAGIWAAGKPAFGPPPSVTSDPNEDPGMKKGE